MPKLFAAVGLVAAIFLTVIDFSTSFNGIKTVLPAHTTSWILTSCPWLLATPAFTFNGSSAYLFRHFRMEGLGGAASLILFCCWIAFLLYDWTTSLVGVLAEFVGGNTVGSLPGIVAAFNSLDIAQRILAVTIAALACAGPFLASAFGDLLAEQLGLSTDIVDGTVRDLHRRMTRDDARS